MKYKENDIVLCKVRICLVDESDPHLPYMVQDIDSACETKYVSEDDLVKRDSGYAKRSDVIKETLDAVKEVTNGCIARRCVSDYTPNYALLKKDLADKFDQLEQQLTKPTRED